MKTLGLRLVEPYYSRRAGLFLESALEGNSRSSEDSRDSFVQSSHFCFHVFYQPSCRRSNLALNHIICLKPLI
jgi:hypothetical protein